MRPISRRVRKIIDTDPFYRICCVTEELKGVTMQHCWIYGGQQIDEAWAIVGLVARYNTSHPPVDVKEKYQLVSLIRATAEDLDKYPRKDWGQIKKYLIGKYPEFYQIALKKYGGNKISMACPGPGYRSVPDSTRIAKAPASEPNQQAAGPALESDAMRKSLCRGSISGHRCDIQNQF